MPLTESGRGTGLAVAVDLVNSWDEFVRPPELLRDVESLRTWLRWHGFEEAVRVVTEGDVPRARELRARLTRVFDASSEAESVAILNDLLAELGRPPRLERAAGGWRLRCWPDEREGLSSAVAYGALGLLEAIRDGGWERLGRCGGSPCRCVYVDRSRNRSRRYCCELCADRVAQAQHRRRRAERL